MSKLSQLLNAANAVADTSEDMNEATKGGGGGRLLPAGYAFARLVEYVELGYHREEFQGVVKEPALTFQLGFALYGEGYQNEDGSPYIIRPFSIRYSRNDKSKCFKLFAKLNYKGTAKHYAQLLGQGWLAKIEHVKRKTGDGVVFRLDLDGFLPPLDPVTKQPYPIPEPTDDLYKLFLWDNPTKEAWDSLYIPGTWDDGSSKNKLQEKLLTSVNYEGSALQELLQGPVAALPEAPATPVAAPAVAPVSVPPVGSQAKKGRGAAGPVAPAVPVLP